MKAVRSSSPLASHILAAASTRASARAIIASDAFAADLKRQFDVAGKMMKQARVRPE